MKCVWKLHKIECKRAASTVIAVRVRGQNIARWEICPGHHASVWHVAQELARQRGGSLHTRDMSQPKERSSTDAVHPYVRISRQLSDEMTVTRQRIRESGSTFITRAIVDRIDKFKIRKDVDDECDSGSSGA